MLATAMASELIINTVKIRACTDIYPSKQSGTLLFDHVKGGNGVDEAVARCRHSSTSTSLEDEAEAGRTEDMTVFFLVLRLWVDRLNNE